MKPFHLESIKNMLMIGNAIRRRGDIIPMDTPSKIVEYFHAALAYWVEREGRGAQKQLVYETGFTRSYISRLVRKIVLAKKEETQRAIVAALGEMTYEEFLDLGRRLLEKQKGNGEKHAVVVSEPPKLPEPSATISDIVFTRIPVFDAGSGKPSNFSDQGFPLDLADRYISIPDTGLGEHVYGITIEGRANAPDLNDGDIVAVTPEMPRQGKRCVAYLPDGVILVRRFFQYGDTVVLKAQNPDYEDIDYDITARKDIRLHRVVGSWRSE